MQLEQKAGRWLRPGQLTLSTAESCTGGLLAHRLTNIPGSSDYFIAGLVTYSNLAKTQLLKIPTKILADHGAVSRPVALRMAQKVRQIFATDFGIGITGIAGPGGGTRQKPVGLVYIAVASRRRAKCARCLFKGGRLKIKKQSVDKALNLLLELIKKHPAPK